ncbi:MAG TPA: DoxX family protein [bacterium]
MRVPETAQEAGQGGFALRDGAGRWIPLVLRVLMGALFIVHGSGKLMAAIQDPHIAGFTKSVDAIGFHPGLFWAWVVTLVEFAGGICLCVGLFTRAAAALITIEMIVAGLKVNLPRGFYWTKGGAEVPLIFAVIGGILTLAGPGAASLDGFLWGRGSRSGATGSPVAGSRQGS